MQNLVTTIIVIISSLTFQEIYPDDYGRVIDVICPNPSENIKYDFRCSANDCLAAEFAWDRT